MTSQATISTNICETVKAVGNYREQIEQFDVLMQNMPIDIHKRSKYRNYNPFPFPKKRHPPN